MNIRSQNFDTRIPSLQGKVSLEEWEARVNLAACYRLVHLWEMSDMIANHISVRVPGERDHFLINPYGCLYEEITASSLVKIDFDGNIVWKPDFDYGINRAGFVIHSAIHRARHDLDCVIHTHTAAGMAVSALDCGLLPITQMAMRFWSVAYHDYEGVAIKLNEQERLLRDLGDSDLMILRNHGLLAVGQTVMQAFDTIRRAELACKTQIMAMSTGAKLVIPPKVIIEETGNLYRPQTRRPFGVLEWPALLRKLDRIDPSYRN
jgi:ribulose-5-phosphate 4-epimerase/fuculose-1-phosphate aldolase